MTLQEKIQFIEDIMDVDEGSLTEETILEEVEEWDSLSTLTLTVKMKQDYDMNLATETIKEFVTVGDICNYIPN